MRPSERRLERLAEWKPEHRSSRLTGPYEGRLEALEKSPSSLEPSVDRARYDSRPEDFKSAPRVV